MERMEANNVAKRTYVAEQKLSAYVVSVVKQQAQAITQLERGQGGECLHQHLWSQNIPKMELSSL